MNGPMFDGALTSAAFWGGPAQVIAGAMLLGGGFFALVAGLGIVRFPDAFTRMHAATKAGTLGVGLIVVALALVSEEGRVIGKAVATAVFLLATAPIGAHLIGRAAARSLDSAEDTRRDGPLDGGAGD
jgi:multicomponent Na+:H+ antiporter subunit G